MLPSCSSSTRVAVRRMFFLVLAVAGSCFALQSFLLSPVYIRFASDVAYSSTWWVTVLYLLIDGGLLSLAVFTVCYPATLYAVWRAGLRGAIRVPVLYALLTVLKFTADFFMSALTDGALPDWAEFVEVDLLTIILPEIFLELLQYALMILFVCLWRCSYVRKKEMADLVRLENAQRERKHDRRHAASAEIDETDELVPEDVDPTPAAATSVFPLRGFLSVRHPVQGPLFFTALVLLIGRIYMNFIYQLTLYNWYGQTDGWVQMLLTFISDVIIVLLFYFLSLLQLMKHDERANLFAQD